MSILNLEYSGGRAPRNKRAVKVWVGVGLVAAVLGVGSTLASTITLNNGKATEFGQGISTTIYCGGDKQTVQVTPISQFDNTVQVTPISQFDNTVLSPEQDFYLGQIKVTGIPSACAGVDFSVSIFDNKGTPNPLPMNADMQSSLTANVLTAGTANVWFPDGCPIASNILLACADPQPGAQATGALIWYDSPTGPIAMDAALSTNVAVVSNHTLADAGSFTLTLPTPWLIKASDVAKIIVETKVDTNGFNLWSNTQGALT